MKLGILINSDRHAEDVKGLTLAAIRQGHEVSLFFTADGIRLLQDRSIADLCGEGGVAMSYCEHSAEMREVPLDGCDNRILCGSQHNYAEMQHEADRVIVL